MPEQPMIGNRRVTHEASTKEIDWDLLAYTLAMSYIASLKNEGSVNEKTSETVG